MRVKPLALAVTSAFFSAGVAAQTASSTLPTGGQVAAGAATLTYTPNKLQIDQSSNKAILNWDSFSIGSSAWVNFSQPSASSVALNRVGGTNPSEIFGRLSSNGQVFLTNPNGVLFAPSASVDVGGLFATTLAIADKDFLAGRYNFYNAGGAGSVVNQGVITATGYASLAGPQVRNDGIIIARAGTVALAAGDRVSLDMIGDGLIKVSVDQAALNASAINSGRIEADGGNVILTARSANALLDTVVNNSGVIRANSLVERNGEIVLDGGSAGVVANTGTLKTAGIDAGTKGGTITVIGDKVGIAGMVDASGDAGGGAVIIGRGASVTVVEAGASIRADATHEGQGGFVETSGAHLQLSSAPQVGAGGTWLIDPYNLVVTASSSSNSGAPDFAPTGNDSQVDSALIVGQLNAGANVVLDTGGAGSPGSQLGDIRIQAPIEKTVANSASLRLKAFHDVDVSAPIFIATGSGFSPSGPGTLAIEAGNAVVVNAPITTPGGGLSIRAANFTNRSAINNGVGGFNAGMSISADAFDLAGGTINGGEGSVGLFTRTATNSLGIESPADTTLTNRDVASITTGPDVPSWNANQLFIGARSLVIGANAHVDVGAKNLLLSSFGGTGTTVEIGTNGLKTQGDVRVDAGSGAIGGNGILAANHLQLVGRGGIGTSTQRLATAANTLSVNTSGNAFIAQAGDVALDTFSFAGGTIFNNVGGTLDLQTRGAITVGAPVNSGGPMNVAADGAMRLMPTGPQNAALNSRGGQIISADSLALAARAGGASISNIGGNQEITIGAGGIALDAAAGAANTFATIVGSNQVITTSGDLHLVGGALAGTAARIGGPAATPTSLTLTARDVTLTGGAGGFGAILGSSALGAPQANVISVNARELVMESGSGSGATIGTQTSSAPTGGDITVHAAGIQLNGTTQPTAIRTSGSVALHATGSISEGANGFVTATALTTSSGADTALAGPNQVAVLDATGATFALNNTGALNVTRLAAGDTSLTNAGALTVSGPWTSSTTSIAAADVTINAPLTTVGALTIDAAGTVAIRNAMVRSWGGQTVNARAVEVTASNGGFAALWNSGLVEQKISASDGAGVDVRARSGGLAQVMADGGSSQTIKVTNGEHIAIDGAGGSAVVIASNSPQTLSITGSGANAIRIGSAGAMGSSIAHGSLHQSVTAGNLGELGSITIVGPGVNGALAGLYTNPNAGGTQTVSTSGTISITGGNASNQPPNFFSGISHNGSGAQTITAAGITIAAGSTGNGNVATLSSFGGGVAANSGDQFIHVDHGDIRVTGGAGGVSNRAQIVGFANQTIDGHADIVLSGGAGGTGSTATNTQNGALINAPTPGRAQEIHAATIRLAGGEGRDAVATMLSSTQVITASGDVRLTGGSGAGTPVARIGGLGGTPTNLSLSASNLVLTGGGAGGEAALGTAAIGVAQPSTIHINTTGDVILNAGSGAPARIGTPLNSATPAAGDVSIVAGRDIQLNGADRPAVVRTSGRVMLSAGGEIRESGNAFVVASAVDATSGGSIVLGGTNQVALFSGASGGDMTLNNASPLLTLGSLSSGGIFTLTQAGDASFTRSAALGALNASATGSVYVLGGASSGAASEIVSRGPINLVTGADLRIIGGSGSGAFAALKSYSDINLTLGGALRINEGSGHDAYARLQTVDRDSAINIHFPNLADGGYFVNDVQGALRRGHTGILSGEGVAVPEHTLFITYGQ